jgi:hypothetical protein
MSTSDSDRILAEGAPITLSDGRAVRLKYGMRALKRLEDTYGSTIAIDTAVQDVLNAKGKLLTTLSTLMLAGLMHEPPLNGEGTLTEDAIEELFDLKRVGEYALAVSNAFQQAFGFDEEPVKAKGKAKAASPGPTGTDSQSSPAHAPKPTSGA